ncbi:MAG TPA: DUF2846 domain-containing protein [Pyrinomonadaceae bacterium]|nr:DUF2846 domain-containing protein [Acidobacteriota bacterium]HQZ97283.1 DUF2846 domain-containing protein [Pyrinomonadaceae bacterium]
MLALTKAGLSAEVIIAKIKSSAGKYDTSTEKLKELKDAGVADAVILAVVENPLGKSTQAIAGDENIIPGENQAVVYIYRRKEFSTRNLQPSVFIDDDKEVARIDDGKFFILKFDPGKHKIYVNKGFSGAAIDMKAGRRYFFRVTYKPGFWKARGEMEFVPYEQGTLEVANMEPLEEKWIKDKSRVFVMVSKPKN